MTETVRVLVTGSRTWDDVDYLEKVFSAWDARIGSNVRKVLVSGNCPSGADMLAEKAVEKLGWELELYPADWDKHGRRAGFVRNSEMVESSPDFVVAFIKDNSKGASMTARLARKNELPVEEHSVETGKPVNVSKSGFPKSSPANIWDTPSTLW